MVDDLFREHADGLGLELFAGKSGLKRKILIPEAERPGLSLSGYLKNHSKKRILIFGRVENDYLKDLTKQERISRLNAILSDSTPAVMIARHLRPAKELVDLCESKKIPLFRSWKTTMNLMSRLTMLLLDEFAPSLCCQGTLVEVFGVGVLIQGDSAVGKSEAALGLIEKGHRLVSDDIVKVKKREGGYLEGCGAELSRYHMEIRGIGIINVANLYGAVCVRERKSVDLVVRLEAFNDTRTYDRTGVEEKRITLLGVEIPYHILPVRAGQDIVLFLETIALNHRLKKMGYHSAKEFKAKLNHEIARKEQMEMKKLKTCKSGARRNGRIQPTH